MIIKLKKNFFMNKICFLLVLILQLLACFIHIFIAQVSTVLSCSKQLQNFLTSLLSSLQFKIYDFQKPKTKLIFLELNNQLQHLAQSSLLQFINFLFQPLHEG